MNFILALCILLPSMVLGASPEVEAQIRRVESALVQANQEQQTLHLQFQMIQEIRRIESDQFLASIPQAGVAAPPMNYDDITRLRQDNESRSRQHIDELTRLYSRFRDIEEEKLRLRERLNQLLETQ